MKRYFLLWFCLCMTCMVRADGGGFDVRQTVKISKAGGKLTAEPDYVYLDPKNPLINVESSLPITCEASGIEVKLEQQTASSGSRFFCPTEQSAREPKLIFRVPGTDDSVSVDVFSFGAEPSLLHYFGLLFSIFIAGLCLRQWLGIRSVLKTDRVPHWVRKLLPLRTSQEVGLLLLQDRLKEFNQKLLVASSGPQAGTSAESASDLEQCITAFLEAAENWRKEAGGEFPSGVREHLEQIKILRPGPARRVQDKRIFHTTASTVVQLIVWACDDHYDPHYQNNRFQTPIEQMAEAAGLELVNPARGQRFVETEHEQVRTESAPMPGNHGQIARTVRRGMKDSKSIICKAEVHVFDWAPR